jgi:hypothetical protein
MHHSLDGIDLGGIIPTPNFFLILIFYSTRSSKEDSSPQGRQGPHQEGRLQEGHQEGRRQEGHQEGRRQEGHQEGPRRQEALIRFLD